MKDFDCFRELSFCFFPPIDLDCTISFKNELWTFTASTYTDSMLSAVMSMWGHAFLQGWVDVCVGVNKNTHVTTSVFMQHMRTYSCGPLHASVKPPVYVVNVCSWKKVACMNVRCWVKRQVSPLAPPPVSIIQTLHVWEACSTWFPWSCAMSFFRQEAWLRSNECHMLLHADLRTHNSVWQLLRAFMHWSQREPSYLWSVMQKWNKKMLTWK